MNTRSKERTLSEEHIREKDIDSKIENFILDLHSCGGIRTNEEKYKTRNDGDHPIYIDMRVCMDDPELMKNLSDIFIAELKNLKELKYISAFCGVPSGSLHLASVLAYQTNKSIIIPRDKPKVVSFDGVPMETNFFVIIKNPGCICLVEDVVTTGKSVHKIYKKIKKDNPTIDVAVLCFLTKRKITKGGTSICSITSMRFLLEVLEKHRLVSSRKAYEIYRFFSPDKEPSFPISVKERSTLLEGERSSPPKKEGDDQNPPPPSNTGIHSPILLGGLRYLNNEILQNAVISKKSKIIIALDVADWVEAKRYIHLLGRYVCGFKFHFDVCLGVDYKELMNLSEIYDFVILRDRKYGDVAHINTIIDHNIDIPNIINIVHGFVDFDKLDSHGSYLVVLEMSESNLLSGPEYRNKVLSMTKNKDNIIGYISQHKWWSTTGKFCVTPGIKNSEDVIRAEGLVIIGRMILNDDDPLEKLMKMNNLIYSK